MLDPAVLLHLADSPADIPADLTEKAILKDGEGGERSRERSREPSRPRGSWQSGIPPISTFHQALHLLRLVRVPASKVSAELRLPHSISTERTDQEGRVLHLDNIQH
jgi:hypothetical protein